MPSHIFWHLSQSWVTIQTRVTGKEFLNQRYQSRVSLRSLNTRYTLLASKGAVHSVFWRNKHAGYILQVWNATDNVYCLRGRWILNLSPPVSPLLSFSQPLAERRPLGRCAWSGSCSIPVYWITFPAWQPLSHWTDIPPPMSSVISASVAAAASGWEVSMFALKMSTLHLSQHSDSLISSFPAALKSVQNKWCTKDS